MSMFAFWTEGGASETVFLHILWLLLHSSGCRAPHWPGNRHLLSNQETEGERESGFFPSSLAPTWIPRDLVNNDWKSQQAADVGQEVWPHLLLWLQARCQLAEKPVLGDSQSPWPGLGHNGNKRTMGTGRGAQPERVLIMFKKRNTPRSPGKKKKPSQCTSWLS